MNFKKLDSTKKLEYILELQNQGLNRKAIAYKVGYTRVDTLDRFMTKQGYTKQNDNYVLGVEDNSPTSSMQPNRKPLEVTPKGKEDNYIPTVLHIKEEQRKLNNILDNHTEILDMLEWFREVKAKYPTIDIPLTFNIDYEKSDVTKTTIRVDKKIWNDFSKICENKYSHLSKVDIVSQILKNFIDEHE